MPGDGIRFENVSFTYPGSDRAGAGGHFAAHSAR